MQLFTLILLAIGVILGSVGMGIGQWTRFDTDRVDNSVVDGSTFKTQSLLSRCVSYELTQEIVELGLSIDEQPQVGAWVRLGKEGGGREWKEWRQEMVGQDFLNTTGPKVTPLICGPMGTDSAASESNSKDGCKNLD